MPLCRRHAQTKSPVSKGLGPGGCIAGRKANRAQPLRGAIQVRSMELLDRDEGKEKHFQKSEFLIKKRIPINTFHNVTGLQRNCIYSRFNWSSAHLSNIESMRRGKNDSLPMCNRAPSCTHRCNWQSKRFIYSFMQHN
jgi:hypothetical protein